MPQHDSKLLPTVTSELVLSKAFHKYKPEISDVQITMLPMKEIPGLVPNVSTKSSVHTII